MTKARKMRKMNGGRRLLAVLAVVLCLGAVILGVARVSAGAADSRSIRYTSVRVDQGDTLWDIAEEWSEEKSVSAVSAYVETLKSLNGITRTDNLKIGSYITVYYYR